MEINVSKNELAGALAALGKLVSRTSPVEAFRSVEITGEAKQISFRTANADESITFGMNAEVAEPFAALVNFDDFRTVVRGSRNKTVSLTVDAGKFAVDGLALPLVEDTLCDMPEPPADCAGVPLPMGFVGFLSKAAPLVNRSEYRRVLQGVHLCPDGIVVTNGKELLNIEASLNIEPLTLPFPLALLATKCETAAGSLSTWQKQDTRFFSIAIGPWVWTGEALKGVYPNWKQVVPKTDTLNHIVKFDDGNAAKLTDFLKTVPDDQPNTPIVLAQGSDGLKAIAANGQETSIPAEFPTAWSDFEITVHKTLLMHLLAEGHRQLACGNERDPFIASGGIGTYVAMPLAVKPVSTNQQPPKEEKQMSVITPKVVAAPIQPVVPNEEVELNPMDELATAIEEFKGKIRLMLEESAALSRKVKEVMLAQKQKERDFIQAKRAIERIRMAI